MKKQIFVSAAVLSLVFLGASCSFVAQAPSDNSTETTTKTSTNNSTTTSDKATDSDTKNTSDTSDVNAGSGSLPAGYPSDGPVVYPGAKIISGTEDNKEFSVTAYSYNELDLAKLRAFYVKEASDKGWTPVLKESEIAANDTVYVNSFTKDGIAKGMGVQLLKSQDETGKPYVLITLQVNERSIQ